MRHSRTVPSAEPEATTPTRGAIWRHETAPVWPTSTTPRASSSPSSSPPPSGSHVRSMSSASLRASSAAPRWLRALDGGDDALDGGDAASLEWLRRKAMPSTRSSSGISSSSSSVGRAPPLAALARDAARARRPARARTTAAAVAVSESSPPHSSSAPSLSSESSPSRPATAARAARPRPPPRGRC